MDINMTKLMNNLKKETESYRNSESKTAAGVRKVARLTKLAKVPTWTKKMSLETYVKQLASWSELNADVSEYSGYQDMYIIQRVCCHNNPWSKTFYLPSITLYLNM